MARYPKNSKLPKAAKKRTPRLRGESLDKINRRWDSAPQAFRRAVESNTRRFTGMPRVPDQIDRHFLATGRYAIETLNLGIDLETWGGQLDAMFDHVRRWCQRHADRVTGCYAIPHAETVRLYFVQPSEPLDFDLADELTALDRVLVKRFKTGMVELHQIPQRAVSSFISPSSSRTVYDHPVAHRTVEA